MAQEIERLEAAVEEALKNRRPLYIPKKGDLIDECLADYLNKNPVPVKFIRVEEGLYSFGLRRVNVKIQNQKLVIRVGGGYMLIDEFLKMYTNQELSKIKEKGEFHLLSYPIESDMMNDYNSSPVLEK